MPVYKSDTPTKSGNAYYFRVHYKDAFGINKQYTSKKYKTKKEAEKAEAVFRLSEEQKPKVDYTFNLIAKPFLEEKKARLKKHSYDRCETMLNHMLATLGDVKVSDLTVQQYQAALKYLDEYNFNGKTLAPQYKNKILANFKQLIAFANKRYDIYTNIPNKFDPYAKEDKIEEMHFITLDQFNQLAAVIDDPCHKALFTFLFFMGTRIGEANALTWNDIADGSVKINKTVSTKSRDAEGNYLLTTPKTKSSNRTLPLPEIVSKALNAWYDKVSRAYGFSPSWFVFGGLTPIPESSLQKIKQRYFEKANLPQIRIHDFRHSCASYLINNGATVLLVSKWLGHANPTMTLKVYSHLWQSELFQIVDTINNQTSKIEI